MQSCSDAPRAGWWVGICSPWAGWPPLNFRVPCTGPHLLGFLKPSMRPPLPQCSSTTAQACPPREEPPAAYTQMQTLPRFPNPKGWRHQRLIVNRQDPERTLCRGPLGHRQPSLGPKGRGLTCQPTRCMHLCWGAQGYGILRHGHTDLSWHGPCSLATVVSLPQVPPSGRPPHAVQHGKHLSTHNRVG